MIDDLFTPVPAPDAACVLRNYQTEAVAGVETQWQQHRCVLGAAATGSGKSEIACELIKRAGCRTMAIMHRTELVDQFRRRLLKFGIRADIEKADRHASVKLWDRSQVVIATPQTLYSRDGARLRRFNPSEFELLFCDEAHHFVSPKFQSVINHFKQNPNLKAFFCTATPDRHDGKALAKIIDSVAFNIEIQDLIEQGWLVPVRQAIVPVEGLDFSRCHLTAGDFNQRDLGDMMMQDKPLMGVVYATLEEVKDKRTLVFAATVEQAEAYCRLFNRYKPNSSSTVFGHTKEQERKDVFKRFHNGSLQILVNVGVVTEGVDVPGIEAVVVARPTLSRALYCQMIGRGTRPLSGLVDQFHNAEERRSAIAASTKPDLLVLDFKGNALRHKLTITATDILGGKFSEEAKARVRAKIEKAGRGDVLAELKEAEEDVRLRGLTPTAKYRVTYIDPFEAFHKNKVRWQGFQQTHGLSVKQRARLLKNGWNPDEHSVQESIAKHGELISASGKQRSFLRYCGAPKEVYEDPNLAIWTAAKLLDSCVKNGKRWPKTTAGGDAL